MLALVKNLADREVGHLCLITGCPGHVQQATDLAQLLGTRLLPKMKSLFVSKNRSHLVVHQVVLMPHSLWSGDPHHSIPHLHRRLSMRA